MNKDYIVVLSLWKRGQWLNEQVSIMRRQSLPPKEIWLCWGINEKTCDFTEDELKAIGIDKVFRLDDGGSVFSRFEVASKHGDQYFMILDDDLFPTDNYMESCFDLLNFINKEGIISCGGRKFTKRGSYHPHIALGVIKPCPNDVKIDMGTNGWLLTSNAIDCMLEHHERHGYNNCEDIALSYLNRKHRNVDTYVIKQDKTTMACRFGGRRGVDENALSNPKNHKVFYAQRNEVLRYYQDHEK